MRLLVLFYKFFFEVIVWGWRDSSAVRSTDYSSQRPQLNSQHLRDSLAPNSNSRSEDLVAFFGFCRCLEFMWCTEIQAGKTRCTSNIRFLEMDCVSVHVCSRVFSGGRGQLQESVVSFHCGF